MHPFCSPTRYCPVIVRIAILDLPRSSMTKGVGSCGWSAFTRPSLSTDQYFPLCPMQQFSADSVIISLMHHRSISSDCCKPHERMKQKVRGRGYQMTFESHLVPTKKESAWQTKYLFRPILYRPNTYISTL